MKAIVLCLVICASALCAADEIKIGVVGAFSGDLASYGIPTRKACEIIAKKVNDAGGIKGRKIRLITEDDSCKPEIAANVASKIAGEKVIAVIGHICSGATKSAVGIYRSSGIICISPSATTPDLTGGRYPNFFRTIAPDNAQAMLVTSFTRNLKNCFRIAVLHDKGDYGKGFAEYVKRYFAEQDRGHVVLFEGVTPGAVDYTAIINKVVNLKADALVFGGYHPEASKIVAQMRKRGVTIPFISDDGVKDDTFIKVAGTYAEGVYASGPRDTTKNPLAVQAFAEHKKTYGDEAGAFYLNAYAAMTALVNAIDKAKTISYDGVSAALRGEYVDTPLGKISFDKQGDAIGVGFSMYQVVKGAYVELK